MRSGSPPSPASETERQVQEDLVRLEAYRAQLSSLWRQLDYLRLSIAEHSRARQVLEDVDRWDRERELLLPLGGETYLRARPGDLDRVLLGMGAGVVAELPRAAALEKINERLLRLEKADRELEGQARRMEQETQALSERLEAIAEQGPAEGPARTGPGRSPHVGSP
jgi:prefoldin alpha subunit